MRLQKMINGSAQEKERYEEVRQAKNNLFFGSKLFNTIFLEPQSKKNTSQVFLSPFQHFRICDI
jgi:hypothetical protein